MTKEEFIAAANKATINDLLVIKRRKSYTMALHWPHYRIAQFKENTFVVKDFWGKKVSETSYSNVRKVSIEHWICR